jgi:glycosyltransferase involved in cell wall biosynthesis
MYSHPEYDLAEFPHAHRALRKLELGISLGTRLSSPIKNLYAMLETTRRSEIVHFQWSLGARNDRVIWPILKRIGKHLVYTAHDVLPHEPEIMSLEHCRWVYQSAEALFVHGEHLKRLLLQHFDVNPSKIHVIPHGNYNFISDTPGPWNRATARASFGWDEKDRVVLFFGLIRAYKGIDTLLEACRLLRDRLSDGRRLRLVIAGRVFGNHWNEGRYEEQIRNAKLGDAVHLHLGHIPMQDIPRFFRAADVIAVPYKRGSQSGVLRLAYSFGTAAVATKVGSLSELSAEDLTHFVPPEDAEALATALGGLLGNPDAARALGERARRYADTELSWAGIATTTRALYDSLLRST